MDILNQTPIMTEYEVAPLVAAAVFAILTVVLVVTQPDDHYKDWVFYTILSLIILTVVSVIAVPVARGLNKETGRFRYEVLLNGELSCRDIYDRYEVLERRGSIWVLEDRED